MLMLNIYGWWQHLQLLSSESGGARKSLSFPARSGILALRPRLAKPRLVVIDQWITATNATPPCSTGLELYSLVRSQKGVDIQQSRATRRYRRLSSFWLPTGHSIDSISPVPASSGFHLTLSMTLCPRIKDIFVSPSVLWSVEVV